MSNFNVFYRLRKTYEPGIIKIKDNSLSSAIFSTYSISLFVGVRISNLNLRSYS